MSRRFARWIWLAATVIAGATQLAHAGQHPNPDASALPAVRLRVDTLAEFITQVAGLRVRVVNGVVDEIASPRVFTLRNERGMRYLTGPPEVAIVLLAGEAIIRKDAPVVVTGMARTLLGAEMSREQPLPALTNDERGAITNRPIVVASSVETPGGVQLVRPQR